MTAEVILAKLGAGLPTVVHCTCEDESDGCGSKFSLVVVSTAFDGMPLLARHRAVNTCLADEIAKIHAITMKTLAPSQWEAKNAE